MEKIKHDLKKQLITAVILTVSLPLGGVLLGVGLGIGQPGVWAVGIAFMVAGFYGCPIAWAAGYGNTKGLVRVVNAVRDEHLYTVQEISAQLGVNERQVRMKLDACFNKQYLTGFKREGDVIKANFNKDILNRTLSAECVNCGAKFSYNAADHAPRCPYCGSPVPTDNAKIY